jgi:hypothetical protein
VFLVVDFSDVSGLTIQRVDGGYFFLRPGTEPIACKHSGEVLQIVETFFKLKVPFEWDPAEVISQPCTACIVARCSTPHGTSGYAVTWVMATPPHQQFLRFAPLEVVRVIARWMGLVQRMSPMRMIEPPPETGAS